MRKQVQAFVLILGLTYASPVIASDLVGPPAEQAERAKPKKDEDTAPTARAKTPSDKPPTAPDADPEGPVDPIEVESGGVGVPAVTCAEQHENRRPAAVVARIERSFAGQEIACAEQYTYRTCEVWTVTTTGGSTVWLSRNGIPLNREPQTYCRAQLDQSVRTMSPPDRPATRGAPPRGDRTPKTTRPTRASRKSGSKGKNGKTDKAQ